MKELFAVIERWRRLSLSWDRNCAMFAADCVLAQTGRDPIGDVREKMTGARGLADVLREGDGSLQSVVTRRLGPQVGPRLARRGDIVGLDRCGMHLGVCVGSTALFLDADGLKSVPMREVACAWAVPRG